MKKYIAEIVGTLVLTLAVGFAIAGSSGLPVPLAAGITLALLVYALTGVSGAHCNPAVTLGLWSLKKIEWRDAIIYIGAQFLGAFFALLIISFFLNGSNELTVENTVRVGLAECIGAAVFGWGIAVAVYHRVRDEWAGVMVGGSLTIGAIIASVTSNGILNPALSMGLGSFNLMYLLGPIIGMAVGMHLYRFLIGERR